MTSCLRAMIKQEDRKVRMCFHRVIASVAVLSVLCAMWATPAVAQRSLVTEDASIIPEGCVQVELGAGIVKGLWNFKSGLSRDQLRLGQMSYFIGTGGRTNVELGWVAAAIQRDPEFGTTHDVGDATFFTKVLLVGETRRRPAIAVRFGTKLPNAGDEDGIGTDESDFYGSFPMAKGFGRLEVRAEPGVGILGSWRKVSAQNDVFTYGSAVLYRSSRYSLFSEVDGRVRWRAARASDLLSVSRLGVILRFGDYSIDAVGTIGLIKESEDWGVSVGVAREVRLWAGADR